MLLLIYDIDGDISLFSCTYYQSYLDSVRKYRCLDVGYHCVLNDDIYIYIYHTNLLFY